MEHRTAAAARSARKAAGRRRCQVRRSGSRSSRKVTARISCSAKPLSVSGSYLAAGWKGATGHSSAIERFGSQRKGQRHHAKPGGASSSSRAAPTSPLPPALPSASLQQVHLPPLSICSALHLAVQGRPPPLQGCRWRAENGARMSSRAAAGNQLQAEQRPAISCRRSSGRQHTHCGTRVLRLHATPYAHLVQGGLLPALLLQVDRPPHLRQAARCLCECELSVVRQAGGRQAAGAAAGGASGVRASIRAPSPSPSLLAGRSGSGGDCGSSTAAQGSAAACCSPWPAADMMISLQAARRDGLGSEMEP